MVCRVEWMSGFGFESMIGLWGWVDEWFVGYCG